MACGKIAGKLRQPGFLVALVLAAILIGQGPAKASSYASPQEVEADFREGLRALAAGDVGAAIRLFRAILAEDPDLPRVRLELARAYFEAREWERSRQEFFAVLSGGVPVSVKANILRFLQAIDARRGFDWDLSIGFATSPEAGRDYDTDTVIVDVFGVPLPFTIEREDGGDYGVRARGSAEYRLEIPGDGDGLRLTAFGGGFFDVFEGTGSAADDYLVGARAGLRGAWPQTTVSGGPVLSMRHFAGEHLEDRFGFESRVEWRSAAGFSFFGSGFAGVVNDRVSDFRDGTVGRVTAGAARSIGGRAQAGVAVGAEFLDAEARFESYTALGAELFGQADVGLGLDAAFRTYLLRQRYRDRIPLLDETRSEWEYGADLELTKTDLFLMGQFSPFVTVGLSRRTSSIDAFSYREIRFEVGVRKSF